MADTRTRGRERQKDERRIFTAKDNMHGRLVTRKELWTGGTYQSRSRLVVGGTRHILLGGVSATYNSTEGRRTRGRTGRHGL